MKVLRTESAGRGSWLLPKFKLVDKALSRLESERACICVHVAWCAHIGQLSQLN